MKISSPCPMSWDSLRGDDRVRYCGKCRLNVYNLADMTPEAVEEIVRKTEGRLCGRLYGRDDQTATVSDCRQSVFRKRLRAALTVALPLLLGAAAWFAWTPSGPDPSAPRTWVNTVFDWIRPKPKMLLGEIACPPPKPANGPVAPQ